MMWQQEQQLIEQLTEGIESGCKACCSFLASLEASRRTALFTHLYIERLQRKVAMVEQLREQADMNWNQTFYLLYFRTLGDRKNQETYLELARRVPYRYVLRERLIPHAVEAMLLGISGLLDLYPNDAYTLNLQSEYTHYAAKYNLQSLPIEAWNLQEIRPANHPVLRLAQAARFFSQDDFMLNRVLACRSKLDLEELFCIETSPYWRTHYIPAKISNDHPKRIGSFKAHIIGINLVAIMQFTYGIATHNEELRNNAFAMLEELPPEDNRYMRLWRNEGIIPHNAFESQALLQLITEHCARRGCKLCPLAKQLIQQ